MMRTFQRGTVPGAVAQAFWQFLDPTKLHCSIILDQECMKWDSQ